MITDKPWGSYQVLLSEPNLKVKKITVKAGNRLSLQRHSRREEYWTIISGHGIVTKGFYRPNLDTYSAFKGVSFHIDKEEIHRIEATTEDIVFIESQIGSYLEEDDIVRFEDDYDRL